MKRFMVIVVIIGALAAPNAGAQDSGTGKPVTPVDWKVDHEKREITATVRVEFWSRSTSQFVLKVGRLFMPVIEGAVERAWSGHKFRCYTVKIDVKASGVATKPTSDPKVIDIELRGGAYFRSFIISGGTDAQNSEKPEDAAIPVHSDQDHLRSAFWIPMSEKGPEGFDSRAYAHEFGHVMGLDDNYEETGGIRPGALDDIMNDHRHGVKPETIQKLVRRSGKVKEDELRCGWELAKDYGGVTLTLEPRCGAIDGHWSFVFGGGVSQAGFSITAVGSVEVDVQAGPNDKPHPATYTVDFSLTGEGLPPDVLAQFQVTGGGNAVLVDTATGARLEVIDGELAGDAMAAAAGISISEPIAGSVGKTLVVAPFSDQCDEGA